MTHPFRFGVQLSALPPEDWAGRLQQIERLGYDSVFWPDHFGVQWEPVAALAAAAAATTRLKVGSLVFGIDYRHPVVLAKAAATIQLLSGGRHEFGLGAGWMESDYREAGMPYERPGLRIERLEEALQIVRSMWTNEKTRFAGKHYEIDEIAAAIEPLPPTPPRVLVGGGGRKVLSVAGRHADIVGVNPKVDEGRVTPDTLLDGLPEATHQKIRWIREAAEAAGRDPDAIELNALVFATAVTDDPSGIRRALGGGKLSEEEVAACPLYLTGSGAELRDVLEARREAYGFSYVVIQGRDPATLEAFAEHVVAPLAGK